MELVRGDLRVGWGPRRRCPHRSQFPHVEKEGIKPADMRRHTVAQVLLQRTGTHS